MVHTIRVWYVPYAYGINTRMVQNIDTFEVSYQFLNVKERLIWLQFSINLLQESCHFPIISVIISVDIYNA